MFNFFKTPRVRKSVSIPLIEGAGDFVTFHNLSDKGEHIAISFADPKQKTEVPMVRIHSECLTGDVFGSAKCDCGDQLQEAIRLLRKEKGILIYLRQEGRGIGLYNKLDAYELQAQGLDTYEANKKLGFGLDERNYLVAAQMLKALGTNEISLLSNNPDKREQLEFFGIKVRECISTGVFLKKANARYLEAKVVKTSHRLNLALDRG
jgi:GTP cyclohydrolase II